MSRGGQAIAVDESGAFVETFSLKTSEEGPLAGLRFAVKDLMDVTGHPTGCGNPTWLATHPTPTVSAVCVEQLLGAGAECVGKTVTDEIAFSLIGENHFYGTPLNPAAPDRVPGGSSSGSASAVACGLADFALGTDTGGSVRVPASNCGIWGLRPTHGLVSVAGVMPFAPTFDTVGVLAGSFEVLDRAARVLLSAESTCAEPPRTIHLIAEAFALVDEEVRQALYEPVVCLKKRYGDRVRETSLGELCGDREAADLSTWLDVYRLLVGVEVNSCLGAWIADARPTFGPAAAAGLAIIDSLDRRSAVVASMRRERYFGGLQKALGRRDLLCLPSAPAVAPMKGTAAHVRTGDYYQRGLSLTAIAGVGRLPQISMPVAFASSAPIGLSLAAAQYEDMFLLDVARIVSSEPMRD